MYKKEKQTTRRNFVKGVTAGAAVAGMLFQNALHAENAGIGTYETPSSQASPEELKYRQLFLNELKPEERQKGFGAQGMFVVFSDNDIIQGCQYFSAMFMGESATKVAGHGPHKHKDPEVLVALGTDPDHPQDLGAEFEVHMGPELEKHVVDKPTLIYIPANFIHCPFRVTKVRRPFMFIQAHYAPKMSEQPLRDLVPADMRDKYIFIDLDGSQKDTYNPKMQPRKPKP